MSKTVPLYGFGGGAGLNFDVKAYSSNEAMLADKPRENTIGIVTGNISKYFFSYSEPENMADGDVWIYTGISSGVAFNALKKNTIEVCPMYAKQMVSGSLTDVVAMSYQGGVWVEWTRYLYNSGNKHTDITGGWVFEAAQGIAYGIGSYTDGESSVSIAISKLGTAIQFRTASKFDLKNFKSLKINIIENTYGASCRFGCSDSTRFSTGGMAAECLIPGKQTGVFEVDVSALNTSLFVGAFIFLADGDSSSNYGKVTFDKIWLE